MHKLIHRYISNIQYFNTNPSISINYHPLTTLMSLLLPASLLVRYMFRYVYCSLDHMLCFYQLKFIYIMYLYIMHIYITVHSSNCQYTWGPCLLFLFISNLPHLNPPPWFLFLSVILNSITQWLNNPDIPH